MTRILNLTVYCSVVAAGYGFVADDITLAYGGVIVGGIVSMIDYLRDTL
jgi:hypothetical protein